jgi:hypothetical protein
MQNKPNFQNAKNTITSVITMSNNDEQRIMDYRKQTQSNPILVTVGWGLLSAAGGLPHHFYFGVPPINSRYNKTTGGLVFQIGWGLSIMSF